MPRAAAREIEKVLRARSRTPSRTRTCAGTATTSYVSAVFVDEGPTLKRWQPRARGRVNQILKRTCHITIKLEQSREARARARAAATSGTAAARPKRRPRSEEEGGGRLMGQKVHPGGLRVGVIHDWKSNWMVSSKEFAGALLEDIKIREHILKKLSHAGLSDILIRKDKQRITIDIYTARPGHRDRQVGRRGRRAAQGSPRADPEERPHQHQRDQAPRARREARRPVDRRAAAEPRLVPPRDEALARLGDPLRRRRRQGSVLRPPRRLGDEPLRAVLGGPRAAAHDPRRHRLRLHRGAYPDRPDRRQGLDQQGRDHARRLRRRSRRRQGDAPGRPGHRAPPRRRHRGPRRLARGRPRPAAGSRGPRPRAPRPARPAWRQAAEARAATASSRRPSAAADQVVADDPGRECRA